MNEITARNYFLILNTLGRKENNVEKEENIQ